MSAPTGQNTLPDGLPLAPGGLDTVPADWATQADAGNPYHAVVKRHDTHTDVPVFEYVLASSLGSALDPITVDDGAGGFEIVFDSNGNVLYAST